MRLLAAIAVVGLLAAACGDASGTDPPLGPGTTAATATLPVPPPAAEAPLQGLALETFVAGAGTVHAIATPPGDDRVYLGVKEGVVLEVDGGEVREFLDVSGRVGSSGLEQGLLGLAFHPDYAENGRVFVHYTDREGDTVVAEHRPGEPDPERLLLAFDQPAGNHNGGMLAFGPDGYLWVGLGDGGGAGDQFGNGQDPATPLGTLLRIDVDAADPYAIPPDNPFATGDGLPEVWAFGLRNPWRFAFDGGLVYVADVGQAEWEEVDVVDATAPGLNYGWPPVEGPACFAEAGCDPSAYVEPVLAYPHAEGCSITGGYVYRGGAIPELTGHYVYGDYCRGWLRSFRHDDGAAVDEREWLTDIGQILTFGLDGGGELLVATGDGTVHRIVPAR